MSRLPWPPLASFLPLDIYAGYGIISLPAKVLSFSIKADFSFLNRYHIIILRPSAVTMELTLAGSPQSDTEGRSISPNSHPTGPPKTSNKKATRSDLVAF